VFLRVSFGILAATLLPGVVAWACSCVPQTPEDIAANADRLVVARIDRMITPGGCTPSDQATVVVTVLETLTGRDQEGETLDLWTYTDDGICGMAQHMRAGETWMLDLTDDGNIHTCSGTVPADSAFADQVIDALEG